MKQLEVQIMGQSYLLTAPDGGEQKLLSAVERVDTAMCRIRDAGKVKARDRIAVLAALNLSFDYEDRTSLATQALPASAPSSAAHAADTSDDPRIKALIARLDQALVSGDGQLL
jgi:cell division protein ZapA